MLLLALREVKLLPKEILTETDPPAVKVQDDVYLQVLRNSVADSEIRGRGQGRRNAPSTPVGVLSKLGDFFFGSGGEAVEVPTLEDPLVEEPNSAPSSPTSPEDVSVDISTIDDIDFVWDEAAESEDEEEEDDQGKMNLPPPSVEVGIDVDGTPLRMITNQPVKVLSKRALLRKVRMGREVEQQRSIRITKHWHQRNATHPITHFTRSSTVSRLELRFWGDCQDDKVSWG